MILGKNMKSFVVAVLRNEPSGRLRNQQQAEKLDRRKETLHERRHTPAPATLHKERTKSQDSGQDCAPVPYRLEEVGHVAAMLRMRDLRRQGRRCRLGETKADTKHDSCPEEGIDTGSSALDDGSSKHDAGPDCYGEAAAHVVANVRRWNEGR